MYDSSHWRYAYAAGVLRVPIWFDLILFYSEEIKTQGIHVYTDITDNYKLKITIKIR